MKFHIKLWIVFYLFSLVRFSQLQNVQSIIDDITTKMENAFSNLKVILRSNVIAADLSNFNTRQINSSTATEILTKSKLDTEVLIVKTNQALNQIQSNLTNSYDPVSSIKNAPACGTVNFASFFRAKSIQNGTIRNISSCANQTLPFYVDPFLDNVLSNRNFSTVHVPINIYEFSLQNQKVSNWTKNLDATFMLKQNDYQLRWQYFCSNLGWFKIFPGIIWKIQAINSIINSRLVDSFDCRSEQFYLQSTAYPKKVIILVDRSGSMTGRSKIVANQTVKEILNTLTENDYFNILLFDAKCSFVDNFTEILISGTDKNKLYILNSLNGIYNPDGIANIAECLKKAFSILENDIKIQTGNVFYNYFISIVTDGSFNYNRHDNINKIGARIFTYLTVQGAPERYTMAKMACANNGFATEMASLSDVKENVQHYLNVVARRNALMQNAFTVWTGIHEMLVKPMGTSTFSNSSITVFPTFLYPNILYSTYLSTQVYPISIEKFKPIKLSVSAAKAVYDQNIVTTRLNQGILLGSAGIDISTDEFIKTVPFWKIGINAYLFGITSNGFLLFHPKYRPQYQTYMKHFYRNVDITEVEIESNISLSSINNYETFQSNNKLRSDLINQSPNNPVKSSVLLNTFEILDDFKTGFTINRNYYVAGIKGTSYKFGLSLPSGQNVPIYSSQNFKIISKNAFINDFKIDYNTLKTQCNIINISKNQGGISMINYEFCHMTPDIASLQMNSPLCALIDVFTNSTLLNDCIINTPESLIYLENIYTEMKNTSNYPQFWASLKGLDNNIQQIFTMHYFGLIRYYNYDNLNYRNFIADHNLGINDPIYKETTLTARFYQNDEILVARPLPNSVSSQNIPPNAIIMTVTTPLSVKGTHIGIVGIQARSDYFQSLLMSNALCYNKTFVNCFIITESGLILLNNQREAFNGILLKDVNCALMESLVNKQIFVVQYLYDFQGLCNNVSVQTYNFSRRLINPFTYLFQQLIWFLFELIIIIRHFSFTSILWLSSNQEENPPYNLTSMNNARPCYLKFLTTMAKPLSTQINGSFSCTLCTLTWLIRPINNTNLLFVVVLKPNADCSCDCSSGFGKTTELTRNSNSSITNPITVNPSYYSEFIAFTKTENSTICTNLKQISAQPLKLGLFISLFVTFYIA